MSDPAPALADSPRPIRERRGVTRAEFESEILPAAEPVVLRGLVADWPLVHVGRGSPAALAGYLRRFDRGVSVPIMQGPPSIGGRFFYNDDLSGFNFRSSTAKVSAVLDYLLGEVEQARPSAVAAQSIPVGESLPGLQHENPMPLLDPGVDPRIWLGNQVIIAAHHDPSENIACVAAGRRRFTLFPPEQVANLYIGPFELTPAGATISLVDFDNPDLDRFPRFAEALASARTAELEPGDAIYIPYLWWHHVRSIERFNVLVNYWWTPPTQPGRGAPRDALYHAMLVLKDLPESHRAAWRAMFEHYVFQADGPPGAHMPAARQGITGDVSPAEARRLRGMLARVLSRA